MHRLWQSRCRYAFLNFARVPVQRNPRNKYGLDRGINFYDTAMGYQGGTSEKFAGRAIKDFAKREDVVLETKFIPRTPLDIQQKIRGQQYIQNMIDCSPNRMGFDYIDLYIYHMWDYHTPIEEIMESLHYVVQAVTIDIPANSSGPGVITPDDNLNPNLNEVIHLSY